MGEAHAHSLLAFPSERRLEVGAQELADTRMALEAYVARTPIMQCWLKELPHDAPLYLKLENLQLAGGVQLRGVLNYVRSLSPAELARGLVTGAAGHHGEAVACAAYLVGTHARIYVPKPAATPDYLSRLRQWNAAVVVRGGTRDDAVRSAVARSRRDGSQFIHTFADRPFVVGYATLALEIVESLPRLQVLVMSSAVRGAHLSGVALAVKQLRPDVRVIGVEPAEAPVTYDSLRAGRLLDVPADTPPGATLAAQVTFDLIRRCVDEMVLVSRAEVAATLRVLWQRLEIAADLAGATAVAAVLTGKIDLTEMSGSCLCAVVGGRGEEGLF